MINLKEPITEFTFIDLIEKVNVDDRYWFSFLQDMFYIGTEEGGLTQIYVLPDLEV